TSRPGLFRGRRGERQTKHRIELGRRARRDLRWLGFGARRRGRRCEGAGVDRRWLRRAGGRRPSLNRRRWFWRVVRARSVRGRRALDGLEARRLDGGRRLRGRGLAPGRGGWGLPVAAEGPVGGAGDADGAGAERGPPLR